MEKINKFILKSPFITSVLTFVSAFILAIIFKSIIGFKSASLENCIYIIVLSFAFSYGYYFKEQMTKFYRLKYALITTFLNFILTISIIYFSTNISQSPLKNILYFSMLMPLIFMPFLIYHGSGYISKMFAKYDFKKQISIEKNMPIEIQKERKTVSLLYFLFISIGLIVFALNERKIIHLPDNILIIFSLLFLGIMLFSAKYFKKTYDMNFTNIDNDKKSDET